MYISYLTNNKTNAYISNQKTHKLEKEEKEEEEEEEIRRRKKENEEEEKEEEEHFSGISVIRLLHK